MNVGATAFTLMPSVPHSTAWQRVMWMTAAFATQPHAGGETPEEVVRHDQRLGELLPVVFGAKGPIGVVDGSGELVGILDRRMVIHVLAGREEPSVPEELPA